MRRFLVVGHGTGGSKVLYCGSDGDEAMKAYDSPRLPKSAGELRLVEYFSNPLPTRRRTFETEEQERIRIAREKAQAAKVEREKEEKVAREKAELEKRLRELDGADAEADASEGGTEGREGSEGGDETDAPEGDADAPEADAPEEETVK